MGHDVRQSVGRELPGVATARQTYLSERAGGLASALTSFRLSNYAHQTPFLCELVCCCSAAYEQKPES